MIPNIVPSHRQQKIYRDFKQRCLYSDERHISTRRRWCVKPHQTIPKELSEYTDEESEQMNLDDALQLILVESLDPVMYNAVVNCTNAKQIWDTLEIINEGSEEVRENKKEILMAQYEHCLLYTSPSPRDRG